MNITVISPKKYWPDQYFVDKAIKIAEEKKRNVTITEDIDAVQGADIVATDTWI